MLKAGNGFFIQIKNGPDDIFSLISLASNDDIQGNCYFSKVCESR